MGAVYEAIQYNMQRSVALKVIPSHDPTTTARFEREAITISRLNHPNTVTVFDYGKTDHGVLYLAMEMLTGQTLGELLKARGALSPHEAVHIATQICRSLSEAHRANIVHRDIKPDNIFLIQVDDDPLFVKVLDFGIAKILKGEDNVDLTGVDRIIGTPKYMSPEQILGEHVDHRSDIYSLGCILFEMLCGGPPFQDSNTTKLMIAHAQQTPPTFAERLPNEALNRIPGPLEAVVRQALSKAPAQRFGDIDAFREALDAALEATNSQLRHAELVDATQIRTNTSISRELSNSGVHGELTDSGDLLSQHSSQTLNRLKPLTDSQPALQQQVASQELSASIARPTPPPAKNRGPIYAILIALLMIGAMVIYLVFKPDPNLSHTAQPSTPERAPAAAEKPAPPPKPAAADPKPVQITLKVLSEPNGARVYEEGRSVGRTPMTIYGEDGDILNYSFEKEGFNPKLARFVLDKDEKEPTFSVKLEPEKPAAKPEPTPEAKARPTPSEPKRSSPSKPKKAPKKSTSDQEKPAEEAKPEPVRPSVPQLEDEKGPTTIERL